MFGLPGKGGKGKTETAKKTPWREISVQPKLNIDGTAIEMQVL